MIEVKIINESNNDTPALATKGSAGVDVRAVSYTHLRAHET